MIEVGRRAMLRAGAAGTALAAGAPVLGRAAMASTAAPDTPRRTMRLDDGWRFHMGHASDVDRDFGWGRNQRSFAKAGAATADAAMPKYDDRHWTAIQLPHDWAVDLPYAPPATPAPKDSEDAVAAHGFKAIGRDHPANSVGWYRRSIEVMPSDRDKAIWIEFDGVFRDSIVFVNGYVAGGSASGYAPFQVMIGDFLDYSGGPNVIAVRADASLGEGWFYEGAGIYRPGTLVIADALHLPAWGVFVRAEPSGAAAQVRVTAEVANARAMAAVASVTHIIIAPDGHRTTFDPAPVQVEAAGTLVTDAAIRLTMARLWSVETPSLYRLVSEIREGGRVIDRVETVFGIRSIAFDAERGFLLNGAPVKLLGVCNHQDHAGVGTAIPDRLHAWRVEQMRGMGCNAWRSAHNPPSQALLDTCDEQGMMMIAETRLNSTSPEALDELDRLVRSSRNHPSIILWSVGNEEPHQGSARGAHISAELVRRVKAIDPTRPTTQAFDQGFGDGATQVVDVVGFNYRIDKIDAFHAAHPKQSVVGTETGSTVSVRGEYANDPARHVSRAYDTEHPWWSSTAEEWWQIVADRPYIAGGFIWTGFDYRGEPTPFPSWPSVASQFGVVDQCGFPKDNYWYYRAWWRREPLVHLLPHWTWPGREGQPIEVWAYSNAAEVELLVNGRSAGRKPNPRNGHVAWSVPYAPGRIEAIGYSLKGRVAAMVQETVGAPAALLVTPDRRAIRGDGRDVAIVTIAVVDGRGRIVPDAANLIHLQLSDGARLIGSGSGNPSEPIDGAVPRRAAFHGLLQAIVRSDGRRPGESITLTAKSTGLRPGSAPIHLLAG